MIITEFYNGQGLGNQLWCYVTTRVIALNKGYDFGIKSPENFKGLYFMDLDFGKQVLGGNGPEGGPPQTLPEGIKHYYMERQITHPDGSDIRTTDEKLINIPDNTKIDGLMQDAKYINDSKNEIKKWLKVREEYERYEFSKDNICIINFRGGGYTKDSNFFLKETYWKNAAANMLKINKDFEFIVITDDIISAKKFFPKYKVCHFNIAKDYVIIKNAKYLILSNSSFAYFPAWLSENLKYCIAPKYWGRHNISDGYWSLGYTIAPGWMYQDKDGRLQDYNACIKESNEYLNKNQNKFLVESKFNPEKLYVPEVPKGRVSPTFLKLARRKLEKIRMDLYKEKQETNILNAIFTISKSLILEIFNIINQWVEVSFTKKTKFPEISKEEQEIFNRLKDKLNIVFDVGARDDLFFYNAKKDCSYHLFEPNKNFTALLKKKISKLKKHDITLNEYGLAEKDADNCVYYKKSQSFEINPYMLEDTESREKYSVRTIDGYIKEKKISRIDFLKIDTEGFDYKVMMGGINSIQNDKISYIQFEYWTGVKKFVDLLEDKYYLYLIMEPVLLKALLEKFYSAMSESQKRINYSKSLIRLDNEIIKLIDEKLAPIGLGGNVFGINKKIQNSEINKLIFEVNILNAAMQQNHSLKNYKKIKKLIKNTFLTIVSLSHIPAIIKNILEYKAKLNWLSKEEIASYRKKIKIYDIFTFFNELDLLEIRFNILEPYVDYFIIVEATETFSGYPKILYYEQNKERFKKWHNKIIHYVIDDIPKNEDDLRSRLYKNKNLSYLNKQIIKDSLTIGNIGNGVARWFNEFYQKEMIKMPLVNLKDDDICYVSDLDEIWNPDLIIDYSKDSIFKPEQIGYQYFLNNRSNEDWHGWTGTIATKYKNIKYSCLNHLRTHRKMKNKYVFLKNGGWHFSFLGGYEGAKKKIEGYKHFWYEPQETLKNLQARVLNNQDYKGRSIKLWKDEDGLPGYILNNKEKYNKLLK